jgi:hypothetical protein
MAAPALIDALWMIAAASGLAIGVGNLVVSEMEVRRVKRSGRNGLVKVDAIWGATEHRVIVLTLALLVVGAWLNMVSNYPPTVVFEMRPYIGFMVTVLVTYISFAQNRRRARIARLFRLGGRDADPQQVGPYRRGSADANTQ